MLKSVMKFVALSIFFCNVVIAADSDIVKIVAVSKTIWKTETFESKEDGASGGGAALGAVGGLAWLGGPIGLVSGALVGNHIEKSTSDKKGIGKITSETINGFRIKLSTGESLKTLVKYKVGQKISRNQISEER